MTDGNTWDGIEDLGNVKRGMPDLTVDDVFRAMDALSERAGIRTQTHGVQCCR